VRPRDTGLAVWAPVAALLLAVGVRVWAYSGQSFSFGSDESRFVAVAQNLANGHAPQGDAEWFGTRIVLLWPVAGLFRAVGAADLTAAAWPLVGSLLSVLAAYLVGREIASARVGAIAAFLVALTPIEALVGTRLRPDAILPGLVGLAIWCALRARGPGPWALWAGVFLGLAWSVRESAVVMLPVLVLAGWGAGLRGLWRGAAGLGAVLLAAVAAYGAVAGDPLRPLVGAGAEGEWRDPIAAFSVDGSYAAALVRDAVDPGTAFFLLAPAVVAAALVLVYRRDGRAVLPGAWLAWSALYLELGTLVNLAKPERYLTLCAIPCALLVALAVDGRFAALAPAALAVVCALALWNLPARDLRHDDSTLPDRVAARLRELPPGPVFAESYTWWAKLTTYTATERLPVPTARDPEFSTAQEVRDARTLTPLPDPDTTAGGYVVTGPVHPRPGWPRNWGPARARIAREARSPELRLVAEVDGAMIWERPR
jgi:4-amino-4-deoxy-L-arabinose transferase-like glycosyltransferase